MVPVPSIHWPAKNTLAMVRGRRRGLQFFLHFIPKIFRKYSEKILTEGRLKSLFDPPSAESAPKGVEDDERGQNGGSFHQQIFRTFLKKSSEKRLTEGRSKFLFNPPSTRSRTKVGFDDDGGGKGGGSFFETFFEIFGKSIDGESREVLVGNLSLIGKLFEIYFVRLIGTPNQQFKKRFCFIGRITLVVQNH